MRDVDVSEVVRKIADAVSGGEVVPVETAHVSGVSFLTVGKHGVEFLEHLASLGLKVSVFTTSNPSAVDVGGVLGVGGEVLENQLKIDRALRKLGVNTTYLCTPYEFVLTRRRTFHAWAESSAVAYINTFRDAWSDKNPGPLALLSAIAGFVPKTPLYTLEGRRPSLVIEVETGAVGPLEAGLIGMLVGEKFGSGVPYFRGLKFLGEESRREFAAAISTYSSIVFAVVERVTPGWREYWEMAEVRDRLRIGEGDLSNFLRDIGEPDAVYIGCPFADLETVLWIYREVSKRGPAKKPIYVSTSPAVYKSLAGLDLSRYNVHLFAGSCLVVSPYGRRFRTIATDSLKAIFYIPKLHGVRTVPCKRERCIDLAYA